MTTFLDNPTNIALVLNLVQELGGLFVNLTSTLQQAHAEGRDVTDAEVASLRNSDAVARQKLNDLITQKEQAEAPQAPEAPEAPQPVPS